MNLLEYLLYLCIFLKYNKYNHFNTIYNKSLWQNSKLYKIKLMFEGFCSCWWNLITGCWQPKFSVSNKWTWICPSLEVVANRIVPTVELSLVNLIRRCCQEVWRIRWWIISPTIVVVSTAEFSILNYTYIWCF